MGYIDDKDKEKPARPWTCSQCKFDGVGRPVHEGVEDKCQSMLDLRQGQRTTHQVVDVYSVQVPDTTAFLTTIKVKI